MEFASEKSAKDSLRKKGFRELASGVWGWQKFRAYVTPYGDSRTYSGRYGNRVIVEAGYLVNYHPYEPENAAESHTKLRERIGGKAYQ